MNWLVIGLFACAVTILLAAEWPRLAAHLAPFRRHAQEPAGRRRRRRSHLTLVDSDELTEIDEEREAFAESVVRDLERLPTIDHRD
jgi:hypothetical protein